MYLTDELYDNVDVAAQIRAALPPRAQVLAAPAAGLLRDRIELRAAQALELPKVQALWENANRAAHKTLLKVLDGGGSVVSTEGGVVVLDLKTLLEDLEARSGVGGRVAAALPRARRRSRSCSPTSSPRRRTSRTRSMACRSCCSCSRSR